MASLVEIQDLTNAAQPGLLQDPACCDVHALSQIMGFEPLPTPPLSPEHINSSPTTNSPYDVEPTDAVMDDRAEALLNEMLQVEQIATFEDEEFSVGSSQNSYASDSPTTNLSDVLIGDVGADLLIQDCMWNSHMYEPRSLFGNVNGIYTPAPSPPPSSDKSNEDDEEQTSKEDTADEASDDTSEQSSDVQSSECISPCDIFPAYSLVDGHQADSHKLKLLEKARSSTSVPEDAARHPQAMSSESEEEIDVVTVTERPLTRMNSRKQRQFSVSAPCSRQSSPTPTSPKKRKYHVKRLQRISSTCSSVGDGTESDDEHRRASHNILERKRRNDLKYSFQVLRAQVPELEDNQRAPKVTILRKAADYIRRIQVEGNSMEKELEKERKREAKLRQRLAFLKAMPVVC